MTNTRSMKKDKIRIRKGVWFDKNNEPVIINGVAQKNLKKGTKLFYYGKVLMTLEDGNNTNKKRRF